MGCTNKIRIRIDKDAVISQWPDIVIKCDYVETDTFEGGLEYGPDTIRKEPPLNRVIYTFEEGATIKYLGSNEWELEASITSRTALSKALRRIIPVNSEEK
jgi:hypothetical protein